MNDREYMGLVLKLARRGLGKTSPNPMVGALLVKDGRIIGQGYHRKAGLPHAEIEAINAASESLQGATLYVNLEPCCTYGKTPPCVDRIIKEKIKSVVCAMTDPNPAVNGKGFQILRNNGIQVNSGVLEQEARKLNEVYCKFIQYRKPFVILKVAQTLDGKIALPSGESQWISNERSRRFAHRLRALTDAVLIGQNTLNIDDPQLTVRLSKGNDPKRIILSHSGKIPQKSKMFGLTRGETIIISPGKPAWFKTKYAGNLEFIELAPDQGKFYSGDLILRILGQKNIASLLIEGGAQTLSWAIQENIVDKYYIIIANKIFGKGTSSFQNLSIQKITDSIQLNIEKLKKIGNDILITGYPQKN
ncbi:bifunctional diaminohydroxyphosphoribosylaminopyrimidine deaminase/5-amino-6-(5-phosphoribosylamino)uracil reductase RibD [bacterium]|nr:bifunctional diaminohydroxyphosphoribosylaminopyrimidine deaminase/5-amino-6-(5-phosphoribosylamino)uracil reductase RibD [bacterium]